MGDDVAEERLLLKTFFSCNQCTPASCRRYQPLKVIGKGSYGVVCSAVDLQAASGEPSLVAIKRISHVFDSVPEALRILREVAFLRAMCNVHPDIVRVRDILMPCNVMAYHDIYIVFDLMDTSLQSAIDRHHEQLTTELIRSFMYQLLRSIAFLHHAGIMHRDLKPGNILVDTHHGPSLKLCDFGLARSHHVVPMPDEDAKPRAPPRRSRRLEQARSRLRVSAPSDFLHRPRRDQPTLSDVVYHHHHNPRQPRGARRDEAAPCPEMHMWTDYVATRWYRAPELCGSFFSGYTEAVDMWSVGCIFGEMILGRAILRGRDTQDQLRRIVQLLGRPSDRDLQSIDSPTARRFVSDVGAGVGAPGFDEAFRAVACPDALDLLRRLLAFRPQDRPTAAEALRHPLFARYPYGFTKDLRDAAVQMRAKIDRISDLDDSCSGLTEEVMRRLMFDEIADWRTDHDDAEIERMSCECLLVRS